MSILMTEYDYATDIAVQREEAYEDGLFAGREEGISIGLERGLEQGISQGAYQNKLETARKLITRGHSAEDIVDLTGLPSLQIKELIAEYF